MAKVIRNVWVYKKQHNYKYMPRSSYGPKEFDIAANNAGPENFPEKMDGELPKLWLAWVYRSAGGEPYWTKRWLNKLFGVKYKVGDMAIFKNTPAQNMELWRLKHLIELRPLTFPNGEPTVDDINCLEVHADGRCVVDKKWECDAKKLQIDHPSNQLSPSYLRFFYRRRYDACKDVFEDNVYTPSNISVLD